MENRLPKSFWEKPEGKTGMLFLGLLGAGGLWGLSTILPAIILLLQNTIYAGVLLGVIGAVVFLALDPKVRNLVSYSYKMIMRWLTGMFIQLDPIAIIEGYVEDLKKNLHKMDQQIGNLRGQMKSLQNFINENNEKKNANLKMASLAKERGKESSLYLNTRKAGRLEKSNVTLNELYTKMEKLYRVLSKMYETSGILLEDISDEVEVKKRERKAILAGHSAFTSAMKILKGDADKQSLFNQTMEYMVEDLGAKVGEMERFMEMSTGFMESVDLENGVFQEKGFEMLEQWEKEGTSVLLGKDKQLLLTQAEDHTNVLDLDRPIVTNKYSELFSAKRRQ